MNLFKKLSSKIRNAIRRDADAGYPSLKTLGWFSLRWVPVIIFSVVMRKKYIAAANDYGLHTNKLRVIARAYDREETKPHWLREANDQIFYENVRSLNSTCRMVYLAHYLFWTAVDLISSRRKR